MQRCSLTSRVESIIESQVNIIEGLELVKARSRFSGSKSANQQPLINQILLLNTEEASSNEDKKKRLMQQALDEIRKKGIATQVLFDISFAERYGR